MRTLAVALLALLSALPVWLPAAAQGQQPLLEDGAGDAQVLLVAGQTGPGGGQVPEADLRSLAAAEAKDAITFTVGVAGLPDPGTPMQGDVSYHVRFAHGEARYQLVIERRVPPGEPPSHAARLEHGHDEYGRHIEDLEVQVDAAAATLTAAVPRHRLVDERGSAPFPGRELSQVHVLAASFPVFGFDPADPDSDASTVRLLDHMPEPGEAQARLPILLGDAASRLLALRSDDPTRMSNGEATTFVFQVVAENRGTAAADFTLRVEGVPDTWGVDFPLPVLRLEPGVPTNATVLVSVPFRHDHGALVEVQVVLEKEGDAAAFARQTLGVRYTEIAQPAGHHDTLFLHGGSSASPLGSGSHFMNTLEDDPRDRGDALRALTGCDDSLEQRDHDWVLPLEPRLAMGLDFTAGTGRFQGTLVAQRPMLGTVVGGELHHSGQGLLATFVPTGPVDLMRDDRLPLDLELRIEPGVDLVPYGKDENLVLLVRATSGPGQAASVCLEAAPALLEPGASLRLPLEEYHDPLASAGPSLFAQPLLRRSAAPGSVVAFAPDLLAGTGEVALELFGTNDEWARLAGPAAVRLGDAATPVRVEVQVPQDAGASDRFDVVLKARPDAGPPSFVRLVLELDPGAAVVDESQAAAGARDAPAPSVLLVALAAAAAAVARRLRA